MNALLFTLVFLFAFNLTAAESVKLKKIEEMHEQEIVSLGEIKVSKEAQKNWQQCVPQESQAFPDSLSKQWKDKIFSSKELEDLKNCKPGSCKHNFLPYEIELLSRIKNEEQLKEQFFRFYKNRVQGLTPISPLDSKSRFKKSDGLSPFCQNTDLFEFLKQRPNKESNFRMSVVQYDNRMRPTTRLLQGSFYKDKEDVCYVETLIFSNHYDIDRLEIWGLNADGNLRLLVRHRIDLLNSWWRRLQKPKLQEALEKATSEQLSKAAKCLDKL